MIVKVVKELRGEEKGETMVFRLHSLALDFCSFKILTFFWVLMNFPTSEEREAEKTIYAL